MRIRRGPPQAVGRCIRHKYDYGAILLLDERFRQPRYRKDLSRWVRGAIATYDAFDAALGSLKVRSCSCNCRALRVLSSALRRVIMRRSCHSCPVALQNMLRTHQPISQLPALQLRLSELEPCSSIFVSIDRRPFSSA